MTAAARAAVIALAVASASGCAELESAQKSQEFGQYLRSLHAVTDPCVRQRGENSEYLFKACEYVVSKKVEVTRHPNTWTVTRVADETVDGKAVLAAHFSCCGPGDVAFFDKDTGNFYAYARKRW